MSDSLQPIRNMALGVLIQRLAARIAGSLEATLRPPSSTPAAPSSFAALIDEAARRYGVPEDLVRAVIQTESNYHADAVSPAGAQGLMQLMPGTARGLGVKDPFDAAQNIEGGVKLLHNLLAAYKDVPLALAAYNAGSGAVNKYHGIPPYAETQAYVRRVMKLYRGVEWDA